jgi:hypothetical protein
MQPARSPESDRKSFAVGYVVLLAVYLTPLFVTRFLPGLDLPFHLAIADALGKMGVSGAPAHTFYERVGLTPYSAYYALVRVFGLALPLRIAHKLVLALIVAALPLALHRLLTATNRSPLPALLAFPLAYAMPLHYGFVSYMLALPLLLLVIAEAFAVARGRARGGWLACAAVALSLTHLLAFAFAAAAVVVVSLCAGRPWRTRVRAPLLILPALVLSIGWARTSTYRGRDVSWLEVLRAAGAARAAEWQRLSPARDALERLRLLPEHLLRGFTDRVDVTASWLVLGLLVAYAAVGWFGRARSRDRTLATVDRASICVLLAAALCYWLVPHHLPQLELMSFYPRFSVVLVALLPLVIPRGPLRVPARVRAAMLVASLLVCGWYGVELARHYRMYAGEVADFAAVLDQIPPGGRLLGLVFDRYSRVMRIESALVGLPAYYPVERRSRASFVPLRYCGMRHIPCRPRPGAPALLAPDAWFPQQLAATPRLVVEQYDYVLARGQAAAMRVLATVAPQLTVLAERGDWVAFRTQRGPQ